MKLLSAVFGTWQLLNNIIRIRVLCGMFYVIEMIMKINVDE